MVDRNDSLLRELDDEVRADRYRKLWSQYSTPIIAAVAAIPVAAGLWQIYEGQTRAAAEAAGARFESARQLTVAKKDGDANKAFAEIIADAPAGYATLAQFQTAAGLVKTDKQAEAVAAYDAIASRDANSGVLRDIARLQSASLRLEAADWTEMENRLTPLTDERNAFRAVARELLGLAAMKAAKPDEARKAFLLILGDAKASAAQKERIQGFMTTLVAADLARGQATEPAGTVPASSPAPTAKP